MAMGLERVPNGFTALGNNNNNNKEKKSSGEPGGGSSRALEKKKTHISAIVSPFCLWNHICPAAHAAKTRPAHTVSSFQ